MNRNALDFTERMDEGRALAMVRYNRGLPTGKSKPRKYAPMSAAEKHEYAASWEWLCREARREWRREWRREVDRARNDFAATCLNGPGWEADLATLGEYHGRAYY